MCVGGISIVMSDHEPALGHPIALLFRAMADRLESSSVDQFGGAFLIVPPGGEAIDGLSLTTVPNPAVFWSSVEGQMTLAIEALRSNQRGFR